MHTLRSHQDLLCKGLWSFFVELEDFGCFSFGIIFFLRHYATSKTLLLTLMQQHEHGVNENDLNNKEVQ